MKTNILLIRLGFLLVVGSLCTLISCNEPDQVQPDSIPLLPPDNMDALVYSDWENPFGKTYSEWITEWIQSFPGSYCRNDENHSGNQHAILDESENVYFLAGSTIIPTTRAITILPGKAILFPVINAINTFPCPLNPLSNETKEKSIEEILVNQADEFLHMEISLSVSLDALPFTEVKNHQFVTNVFPVSNDGMLQNCFDACVTPGITQQAISSGYWIMLRGLSKGEHYLIFKGDVPEYGMQTFVSYHINVQ